MAPTTVGVIGCGKIAHGAHLPGLAAAAAEGVGTVVGVCDLVPEQAQSLAETFGVPRYDSVEALLEKARPRKWSLSSHHPGLIRVSRDQERCRLSRQDAVMSLCEKPIAMSLAEAEEMRGMRRTGTRSTSSASVCSIPPLCEESRLICLVVSVC